MNRFLKIASILLLSALPFFASAQDEISEEEALAIVEETVAKARAYLGGDKALDAVNSIHYEGVLVYGNGQSGTIESIFMKPGYHQAISVIGPQKEISTLNKNEAWQKIERVDRPGAWSLNIYSIDELRALQATVADTLSFLKTPPTRKGRIEYLGTEEVDGRETRKLLYYHGGDRAFLRYFDSETGREVRMINQNGGIFIKSGERLVDGVRFPEKLVVKFITEIGVQSIEISYTNITVNEKFDTDRFNMPVMAE